MDFTRDDARTVQRLVAETIRDLRAQRAHERPSLLKMVGVGHGSRSSAAASAAGNPPTRPAPAREAGRRVMTPARDLPDDQDFIGDDIGPWSEIKLDIIRDYASAYSRILTAQPGLSHAYIDGFAGAGAHRSKASGEIVDGSPRIALSIDPPFKDYFLIDLQRERVEELEALAKGRSDVHICLGDCNEVLVRGVFPLVRYRDYRRALCLLDPYGMNLRWETIATAGATGSVEVIVNVPLGAMNRNALLTRPDRIRPGTAEKMTALWGDESWRDIAYTSQPTLFGGEELEKTSTAKVAAAFRKRLRDVAGFAFVPEPLPMRNSKNVVLYYIYFASQNATGGKIIGDIFEKWRRRGVR